MRFGYLDIQNRGPRIGRCTACGQGGQLNARVCRRCEARYGRRLAELMARARLDPAFARDCYERLTPAARKQFLEVLGGAVRFGPSVRKCSKRRAPPLRVVS